VLFVCFVWVVILVSCLEIDIACNGNRKYYQNDQLLDTICCVRSIIKTSLRPITILQDNVWKSTLMQYSKIDIANIIGNVKNIVNRHLSTLHSKTFVKVEIKHCMPIWISQGLALQCLLFHCKYLTILSARFS